MELSTLKTRAIIAGKITLVAIIFASGVASHNTLERTYRFTADLFAPSTTQYARALSAHDQAVLAEFTASSTQAQCKNAAESRVYLKEAQTNVLKAQHELAESKRLELASQADASTSNFASESNFTASLDVQSASLTYKTGKSSTK